MKTAKHRFFFVAMAGTGLALLFAWGFRKGDPAEAPAIPSSGNPVIAAGKPAVTDAANEVNSPLPPSVTATSAEADLRAEIAAAGRPDADPAVSERRLDLLAARLTSAELERLKITVLDPDAEGDARAVGVELLSRARSDVTLEILSQIAGAAVPDLRETRRLEFERALRGRAVEGLGEHPSPAAEGRLREIASRSAESFLVDRAQRALAARTGNARPPAEQDREALRRLTE